MRRPRLTSIPCRSLALALVCIALPPLAAQVPTSPPPFVETIEVREVEVLVDISALPTFESIGRKAREDFIVVEEGVAHPLTELGAADAAQWIFVLYFDSILAGPEARQRAAIELAGLSERLTAGGLAEIVIADPLPHTLLSTASADALRRQLDELAVAAGREVERTEPSLATATAARLAQLDRLTVEIAARGGGGARSLLLPVGAWPLDPEGLARLTKAKSDGSLEAAEFQPIQETSRALAAYGWVTVPLALRKLREVEEPSAAERRTQVSMGGAGDRRTTVPIVSVSGQGEPTDPATAAQVETLTDFSLMPFAELARASSGALIGESGRLQGTLGDLLRRRQFSYRSPFPQPGRLLALEVRWKGGDGRTLAAPRWLRSSTPPEVSAARLRRLLAGDAAAQTAPAAPASNAGGIQWNTESGRVCFPGDGDKRWIRISTASEKDGQIQLATGQPLQIERTAAGLCVDAPAVGAGRTVHLAEDLENETWTGAASAAN